MLMQSRVCSCSGKTNWKVPKTPKALSTLCSLWVICSECGRENTFFFFIISEGSLPRFLVFLPTAERTCKVFGEKPSEWKSSSLKIENQTSFPELVEVESGRIKVKDTSSLFWVLLTSKTTHSHVLQKFENNQNNLECGLKTVRVLLRS